MSKIICFSLNSFQNYVQYKRDKNRLIGKGSKRLLEWVGARVRWTGGGPILLKKNQKTSLPLPTMVGGIGSWWWRVVAMGVLVAGGGWQQLIAPVDGSSWW